MKRSLFVAALLVVSSVAMAKPLPAGWKVSVKKGKPLLTADKVTVPLYETYNVWDEVKAELSDDGKTLIVRRGYCGMALEPEEDPVTIPMTMVDAKLANAKGMALHVKKKYADAAKLFEQAAKADPSTPVYATNWLSALVMGGDVAGANTQLEGGLGKSNLAWFAWRLAVDPELKALKDQPGTKPFRADKPGKATTKKIGDVAIAVSPLGLVAVRTADNATSYISFVQLDSGTETLRLPLKQAKAIDTVLVNLGFEIAKQKLLSDEQADKLTENLKDAPDVKGIADLGSHYVFIERTGGCDVSEFDVHARTVKH